MLFSGEWLKFPLFSGLPAPFLLRLNASFFLGEVCLFLFPRLVRDKKASNLYFFCFGDLCLFSGFRLGLRVLGFSHISFQGLGFLTPHLLLGFGFSV